jgi:CHAD domain-containing protein
MQRKAIAAVINQHFNKISKLTRKVASDFDKHVVHELRVEMKKLGAFLHLLNTEQHKGQLKISRRLKSFKGYIGIIRNLQLQEHLIQELIPANAHSIEPYLRQLRSEAQGWKKEVMKLIFEHLNFDEERDAMLNSIPKELSNISVRKFLKLKAHEIESLLIFQPVKENSLHELRKLLKGILYNWPYVDQEAETMLPFEMNGLEKLQALSDILGAYGNQCTALDLLQPAYIDNVPDVRGRELLNGARAQLEKRKEQCRLHFISTLLAIRQNMDPSHYAG